MRQFNKVAQAILRTEWQELNRHQLKAKASWGYPGVYLLAYQPSTISKRPIDDLEQVFYVGMSRSIGGVSARLGQFLRGIELNVAHSGAKRFYRNHANNTAFSSLKKRKKFFVVVHTFKCTPNKASRTPKDLRIMGKVTCLEYYLLAAIKEVTGNEPELNQQ